MNMPTNTKFNVSIIRISAAIIALISGIILIASIEAISGLGLIVGSIGMIIAVLVQISGLFFLENQNAIKRVEMIPPKE